MTQLLIEAGRTERQYWRDLWRYRELFYFLAWRDLLVRYKQTFVGVGWSLIRPLLTMIVLTVVFGKLGKMPSGGVPYPLLVFCGMLPWQFFSTAMAESGNSLVSNSNLISKVYFPRLVIIVSSVITSFVDFLISGTLPCCPDDLVPLRASRWPCCFCRFLCCWRSAPRSGSVCGSPPSWSSTAISASLSRSSSSLVFISPRSDSRAASFRSGFASSTRSIRWWESSMVSAGACLVRDNSIYWPALAVAVIEVIVLVASGIWYFRKTEQTFADVI